MMPGKLNPLVKIELSIMLAHRNSGTYRCCTSFVNLRKAPRKAIFYFSDDGDLTALRYNDWKLVFMEQRAVGTLKLWANPFTPLRVPLLFNLRRDPYERANITSNTYYDWFLDHAFAIVPAQAYVGQFVATFKEFPPRQKAASFSMDRVMEVLETPSGAQ